MGMHQKLRQIIYRRKKKFEKQLSQIDEKDEINES